MFFAFSVGIMKVNVVKKKLFLKTKQIDCQKFTTSKYMKQNEIKSITKVFRIFNRM